MNQILKGLALLICGAVVCFILFYATSTLQHRDLLDRAQKGDPVAEEIVGDSYLRGENNFPKDRALGVKWLDKAAHAGQISAMHKLADLYLRGDGVLQSHRLYIIYHAMAADYVDNASLTVIGQAMLTGDDIHKDPDQGVRLITAAAKDDYGPAQSLLGQLYFEGKLVPCDPKAARKWLTSAVQKKDDTASVWLAALDHGEGCTPPEAAEKNSLFGKEITEKEIGKEAAPKKDQTTGADQKKDGSEVQDKTQAKDNAEGTSSGATEKEKDVTPKTDEKTVSEKDGAADLEKAKDKEPAAQ